MSDTTGNLYLTALNAEAKYYPFFGSHTFQGDYGSLPLPEKMRGMLRVMRAALEVGKKQHGQMVTQATRHFAENVRGASDAHHRTYKSIKGIHAITTARFASEEEAISSLEALVQNTYGPEDEGLEKETNYQQD